MDSKLAAPLNQRSQPLATVTPTLNQRRLQRSSAKATPLFSIVFHILCAESSGVEIQFPLPTAPARSSTVLAVRPGLNRENWD